MTHLLITDTDEEAVAALLCQVVPLVDQLNLVSDAYAGTEGCKGRVWYIVYSV